MKLRGKVLSFSIPPLVVTALLLLLVVNTRVTTLMENEINESLRATAYVYRDAISDIEGNNYFLDEDGVLWNGEEYNVTEDTDMIDLLSAETGISLTIFYGDTRVSTSLTDEQGNRMVGTKAGAKAIEQVLVNGGELFAKDLDIGGVKYYGYYIPFYNGEDTVNGSLDDIAGMIFAGMEKTVVSGTVMNVVTNVLLASLVLLIIFILIDSYLVTKMSKRFKASVDSLETAAMGDFTVEADSKLLLVKDESGDVARSLKKLLDKLNDAFTNIKIESNSIDVSAESLDESSKECANVIEQVETAVSDISSGANTQAADTTSTTNKVMEMGSLVEATNISVDKLISISDDMANGGSQASETLAKLKKVNEETKVAIDDIYNQTNTTNESALKINEAVNLITAIAEETNLLSLNASIEAARAGEQGRGFAVVASQIQKLAEQSNESAKTIEEIIHTLISDSEKSVQTMNEVKEIMDRQSSMVNETGEIFSQVIDGISASQDDINEISNIMIKLNSSREEVVDLISNLSAIAEENAASTEETSASVTEVSANVQQVAANAITLKDISNKLNELIDEFKIK